MRFQGRGWEMFRKAMIVIMASAMIWSLLASMRIFDGGHLEEGSELPNLPLTLVTPLAEGAEGGPQTVTIQDFAGRGVVLNFFATWCEPCVAEMPLLERLQRDYGGEDLVVIGVSDQKASTVRAFQRQHDLGILLAVDPGGRLARKLEIRKIPHTVFVGPDGRVVDDVRGVLSESKASEMAETLKNRAKTSGD